MAVTITNNLTNINTCDATTNFAVTGSANSLTLNNDIFIEGTGSVSARLSNAVGGIELTIASTNLSNNHIYFWAQTSSTMSSTGGIRLVLGDGTNTSTWYVAGSSTYPGGFQRYVVDVNQTPDANSGSLNISAVTKVRVEFSLTTSLMGNIQTIWVDRIDRLASGTSYAMDVTGGTTGDRGTWQNIFDNSTNQSIGIVRKVAGVYQIAGPILFGTTGSSDTYFDDTNSICIFTNQVVGNSFYKLDVVGGSGTNVFKLGSVTGSGSSAIGSQGNVIATASKLWTMTVADSDIDEFKLYGCSFLGAGNISFGTSSTALSGSGTTDLIDNTFASPTQIIKNITTTTRNILRNKITFATAADSSLDMIDVDDVDVNNWQIIGASTSSGSGFEKSNSGSATRSISNHNFTQMDTPYISLLANQVWNSINPTWSITNQTQLAFGGSTLAGAEVNENFDLNITVQQPNGTEIQNAYTWLVETTPSISAPTANRQATDINGFASSDILKRTYIGATSSALTTTLHDDQTLKVYFYGRIPFVSLLSVTSAQNPVVTLVSDPNTTEVTQANAITAGSGIITTRGINSNSLLEFENGSGTDLAAGNIVTGDSSGASGTVVEIADGSANSSGKVFLNLRNGTSFTNGEPLTATIGTGPATTWTGDAVASNAERRYRWEINCDGKSMYVVYDFICAKMSTSNGSIDSIYRDAIIWGEDENAYLLQVGISGYKTERTIRISEGVFLTNRGVGTIQYMTSDSGTQFAPASSVTLEVNGVTQGARCYIETLTGGPETVGEELMREEADINGVAQQPYSYTADQPVMIRARLRGYLPFQSTGLITSSGLTVTAVWQKDSISDY